MSFDQQDDRELVPATRRHENSNAAGLDPTSTVLSQADALMRRHRVFVAGADTAAAPTAIPLDDLPVLTDKVDSPPVLASAQFFETARSVFGRHRAIESVLNKCLDEELPIAIEAVTEGLVDQLVAKLSAKAKAGLVERLIKELDKPETE